MLTQHYSKNLLNRKDAKKIYWPNPGNGFGQAVLSFAAARQRKEFPAFASFAP